MPDDGSQLRKIMTSMTQSCACVCVTPSFRDGRQRPPTQLASNSLFSFPSSFSIPFLPLNCSFFLFFSKRNYTSFPLDLRDFFFSFHYSLFWIEFFLLRILQSFLYLFLLLFFSQYSAFFQATTNCHSLFPFTNAPATALHRHHSHTYLRVISLTVLSPRCIVLLYVLLCLKSFAHLLTSQDL